jgi:hypothetical protein
MVKGKVVFANLQESQEDFSCTLHLMCIKEEIKLINKFSEMIDKYHTY